MKFFGVKIRVFRRRVVRRRRKGLKSQYIKYKDQALILAENRIAYFNKIYDFKINKISIRNQKTRWGSCSRGGNISFNYKIALLPEKLTDYIVVHELCHLGQFNHSKDFWNLVAQTIPNHKELRAILNSWQNSSIF